MRGEKIGQKVARNLQTMRKWNLLVVKLEEIGGQNWNLQRPTIWYWSRKSLLIELLRQFFYFIFFFFCVCVCVAFHWHLGLCIVKFISFDWCHFSFRMGDWPCPFGPRRIDHLFSPAPSRCPSSCSTAKLVSSSLKVNSIDLNGCVLKLRTCSWSTFWGILMSGSFDRCSHAGYCDGASS